MRTLRPPRVFIFLFLLHLLASVHISAYCEQARASGPSENVERVRDIRNLLDSWRGDPTILEQARSQLDVILRENPGNASAHREYARYHIMAGFKRNDIVSPASLQAAEASLKTSLRLNPNYADAYVLAGHLYLLMRRNSEAKAALLKAETIGTDDPWLNNNWAAVLLAEGDLQGASLRYKKVVDSNTTNSKAMISALDGLTNYYVRTGQMAEADGIYRKQIAYEPNTAWAYGNYAAFLLCYRDDADAAIENFRVALSKMNYGVARAGLAAALYRKWAAQTLSGQKADAESTLRNVRGLRDGDPVEIVHSFCHGGPAVGEVRRAMGQKAITR